MKVCFRTLADVLPNVAEQVVNDVKEAQQKYSLNVFNDVSEKLLREQILDIARPEHRIRQLVGKFSINFHIEVNVKY